MCFMSKLHDQFVAIMLCFLWAKAYTPKNLRFKSRLCTDNYFMLLEKKSMNECCYMNEMELIVSVGF